MPPRNQARKRKHQSSIDDRPEAATKWKTDKAGDRPSSRDPFERLNEDITSIILGLIPTVDLIRLERVNRKWRAAVKVWIEIFGIRTRYPLSWVPVCHRDPAHTSNGSCYDLFKQRARRACLIQSGRPTKVTKLVNAKNVASAGDYIVWSARTDWTGTNYIFWQSFPHTNPSCKTWPGLISASNFLRESIVLDLFVNEDGIFLAHLKVPETNLPERYVVYSTTERKILWSKYFKIPCTPGQPIPMLIGKSSIYCMKEIENEFTLSAYDIRSGKFLYESPKHLLLSVQRTVPRTLGVKIGVRTVLVNGGKELVLVTRIIVIEPYETMFHIIDGETGIRLHSATYPHYWSCLLYPDPISSYVVVALNLYPSLWWDRTNRNLRTFAIIQKFSYHDEKPTPFSLVSTEVVFPPHNKIQPFGYSSLDPLSLTGVFCFNGDNASVQGSAITPTRNKKFMAVAADMLRHSYPNNVPPPLDQCFVFGQGKSITLPPRPEIGRHERTTAGLPQFSEVEYVQFENEGRMILYCVPDTYIFNF